MSSFGTHQFAPVRSYEELCGQPGHLPRFNPIEDKVNAVLYHYRFGSQCQCGISTCGKFHNEGFVVQLESHLISQIGHCCWKNKFQEIGDIINRYQENQERPRLLHELKQHKAACNAHRSFISKLKAELQPLVEKKNNFKQRYPRLYAELEKQVGIGGQYEVIRVHEAIKAESRGKPEHILRADDFTYDQELVGTVRGCDFIGSSALILLTEAEQKVEAVEKANLVDISFSKLHSITLEASAIDTYIAKAQSLLIAGRLFFSDESASAIRKIEKSEAIRQEARGFDLSNLEGGIASRKLENLKKPNRAQRRGNFGWKIK